MNLKGLGVPDPGCFSPDPDFFPTRIYDPQTRIQQQQKDEDKLFCNLPLFVALNLTKLTIILFRQKFESICIFTQNIVTKLSEIWVEAQGSEICGIRNPEKPSPGSGPRGQKSTGSPIRIHNTGQGVAN
jgi:hypothetical protein